MNNQITQESFLRGILVVVASGTVGLSGVLYTVGGWTAETEGELQRHRERIEILEEIQKSDHDTLIRVEEQGQSSGRKIDWIVDKLTEGL